MRVTWLSLEWPREGQHAGGVGRYLARLAEPLASIVDLTVVTFAGAQPVDGVTFVTLPTPEGRIGRYYGAAWNVRKLVRDTRPDIVHAHGDDFLLAGGVPIVRSFYGTSLGEARFSTGLRKVNHYVLAGAELISQRRAEVRLGIAPEAVEAFNCHYVFPPYLRVRKVVERLPTKEPSVAFIGSFGGRKQGFVAQAAAEKLRRSMPDLRLFVVGPESDRARWAPWVEHRAGLSDAEVSGLLAESWVLAAPSSYEGFGIPILEALDHGIPVVAYPNPGSEYIHSQGLDAPLVLAQGNAFIDAMEAVLEARGLLPEIEAIAAEKLVAKLAARGSPDRLLEIYQTALGDTGKESSPSDRS